MAAGQTDLVYFLGVSAIEDEEAGCEGSGGEVGDGGGGCDADLARLVVEREKKKLQWRDGSEEDENFTKMSFL
jgi:hypothetical protein